MARLGEGRRDVLEHATYPNTYLPHEHFFTLRTSIRMWVWTYVLGMGKRFPG